MTSRESSTASAVWKLPVASITDRVRGIKTNMFKILYWTGGWRLNGKRCQERESFMKGLLADKLTQELCAAFYTKRSETESFLLGLFFLPILVTIVKETSQGNSNRTTSEHGWEKRIIWVLNFVRVLFSKSNIPRNCWKVVILVHFVTSWAGFIEIHKSWS